MTARRRRRLRPVEREGRRHPRAAAGHEATRHGGAYLQSTHVLHNALAAGDCYASANCLTRPPQAAHPRANSTASGRRMSRKAASDANGSDGTLSVSVALLPRLLFRHTVESVRVDAERLSSLTGTRPLSYAAEISARYRRRAACSGTGCDLSHADKSANCADSHTERPPASRTRGTPSDYSARPARQ